MAVCSGLAVIFSLAGMIDDGMYTEEIGAVTTKMGIWRVGVYSATASFSASRDCAVYTAMGCETGCCKGAQKRCTANQALSILGFLPGFAALLLGGLALRGRNPGVIGTVTNFFAGFCYFCIWAIAIGMVAGSDTGYLSPNCVIYVDGHLGAAFGCVLGASFFFVAAGILNVISSKSAGYETM